MPALTHPEGREVLAEAFQEMIGRSATLPELQTLTALTGHESGYYGNGWKSARGLASNNWGAIVDIDKMVSPCAATGFENRDSSPDGGRDAGEVRCFRMYESPLEGAKALVKNTLMSKIGERGPRTRAAASAGDLGAFSQALYDSGYFQGLARHSPAERVNDYARGLLRWAKQAAAQLEEPVVVTAPEASEKGAAFGGVVALGLGAGFYWLWKGKKS